MLLGLDVQVLLHIEEKLFAYLHQAYFREDNGRAVSSPPTCSHVLFVGILVILLWI